MPYIPSNKTENKDDDRSEIDPAVKTLAETIAKMAKRHGYDGAFAGELNYALTRLLQELPRELVSSDQSREELKYWIQPLMYGVLLDVVLEHKRRVNTAYEAEQIVKSGDCYDTPYYTKLIEVVDEDDNFVGYQEIMLKRDDATVNKDTLDDKIVLKKKGGGA